ncbi:protein-glutamate methylesterase/protein-glutamine glutaminase [Methylomonas sp. BW4-1]|uniref:Protein-glutamate methylesterase/protein-glutamine glutaminase n=1 Tax=Methylomonas defluvii TaxID=3045149 RepID=A0ABU4UBR1_9GAMM|nr:MULTISPECIES: chemotaxis response regulator protein-glutamate methylesterase [unclassified Methylomonas]MDX8126280.1 chemotaxis response regulator protein-glutamate methylesterase [Methylomonas sp. OY6]NOV28748.1 chemotaxis response regulator protein-glutamate methylesterase [Methylomonas sp. ZR1]PKD42178.1 chemotaxis response regulator protein-glutamate methylesterase [Methylomonas sp. Kb3]QBC26953.1 chemotaxis response regulator protein-glutamate methylesterase [Methylomonas sp. LW13]
MTKIKLLIVDDSALIRQMLTQIFNEAGDIEVVGTASDPIIAREKIKALNPDVLTLDVEMPRMDGLTFLRNLMRLRPMPVVMISTLTEKGAEVTLDALALGAVDFVAKPKIDVSHGLRAYADEIIGKIRMAAQAKVKALETNRVNVPALNSVNENAASTMKKHFKTTHKIVALGSSTGGTEAVKELVKSLPRTAPAIVITQHLPLAFSASFAKHVNEATEMTACVASDGQLILPGNIYIAPGDQHLMVVRDGARYACRLDDGPPVNRHKPSVDVLFRSVAENVGSNAVGVMLTGMGADGARAMLEMREAGAVNIVQDEASSIVWGMPGEAYKLGAAHHVLSLGKIAEKILALVD